MRPVLPACLLAMLLLSACGDKDPGSAPAWTRLQGPPQGAQADQLAKAQAASKALFASLSGRLQAAMQAGGPSEAIGVCREAAPAISEAIGRANQVRIGRTSFRLRNPQNAPPEWARPYVDERVAEPVHLTHADGRFAALLPIRLKVACLGCHGPADSIAPEVRSALETLYPEDQATGFARGDLRGWFWVEVPKP